ncbi:SCO family protein [Flavobacterium orientale]|uniref:SCO family protein n=1 Tax=Flavobacterium orientale TaxID=1756020 RepID=A0A917DAU1_9FLAO|nr:SCO family protein [Flavobacterium orientale]GGD21727.1 SCO family protein [Flavobacterium orientale]
MLDFIKRNKLLVVVFILFSLVFLTISFILLTPQKKLTIYSPSMVNPEMVDSTVQHISKYHTIADFEFTNQNGKKITPADYEGKIYVADFFFTTCPTICPIMQDNMVEIQNHFKDNPNVLLLSHTVMPDIDSVAVLKKYALEKGVIDSKWNLVTGDKKDIFYIARKSYLAVKTETEGELYDMVHTENFILVDTKKRVRGFYDGTNKEEINRLIEDINHLLAQEN